MRSAASSDSIPLHEITGFLSVEKDDRPRHCARTNENAKSRRTKRVSRSLRDAGRRVADFVGGVIPSGRQPGVGLEKKKKKPIGIHFGPALVALPDASRLQCARAIIEIPLSVGHWKRAAY